MARTAIQLERLLRSQGFGSRPICRALITSGRVCVEGVSCDDPFAEFEPDGLNFTVDGEEWHYCPFVYLVMNKPTGHECSHKPEYHPSVYSLLPRPLLTRGVQAVGRLDQDTTGLLLFSDDGQFIHRFTSPKKMISKVYLVGTRQPVEGQQISDLLDGVKLNDEPLPIAAASCERLDEQTLKLTVTEGKYHLVKRMVAAAGNRVETLRRVSVGGFELPLDLGPGDWRWLNQTDLQRLSGL